MRYLLITFGLICSCFRLVGQPADLATGPDSVYLSMVNSQLEGIEGILESDGYSSFRETEYLWMEEDSTHYIDLELTADKIFRFSVACDLDCDDIDLWMVDINDKVVSEPSEDPYLSVYPIRADTYKLVVRMYECSVEPCLVGVNFLSANQ